MAPKKQLSSSISNQNLKFQNAVILLQTPGTFGRQPMEKPAFSARQLLQHQELLAFSRNFCS
jgi:hypothetical protein